MLARAYSSTVCVFKYSLFGGYSLQKSNQTITHPLDTDYPIIYTERRKTSKLTGLCKTLGDCLYDHSLALGFDNGDAKRSVGWPLDLSSASLENS